ncbi:MAG: metallophosphoesterase [Tyzzerella sp.]|nr:metallophosphoesterase [Tyzzerella sp.]
MRILIVSDTHGSHCNLDEVLEREKDIDMLLHLGDVEGDDDYIEAVMECPVHIVAGNNDYFSYLPREKEIQIGKYKVFMTHGHNYYVSMSTERLKQAARQRGVDIVMYGHTHRPKIDVSDDVIVINPGSLSYPRQEGRKATYVIMEINRAGEAEFTLHYV